MKKSFFYILLIFLPVISFSQKSFIQDVRIDVKNSDDIIISYNLIDKCDSAHFVDFVLTDSRKNIYIPENIDGSIGYNVKKGKNSLTL